MPHDRKQQEERLRASYDFIVFGGEYGVINAGLAVIDGIVTGGAVTLEWLQNEVAKFGIDLATAMATATPPVSPNEPLFGDIMTFHTWEQPFPGVKIPTGNKFVPYVAARRKGGPFGKDDISLRNLGASDFKMWYLDINGNTGSLMLNENRASGAFWRIERTGGSNVRLRNLGASPYYNWYLDINGTTGGLMLNDQVAAGCNWELDDQDGGNCLFRNLAASNFQGYYLDIDGNTGDLILNKNIAPGCHWKLLTS